MRLCNFRSKFLIRILLPLVACLLLTTPSSAQTSPVGWMDMDATLRNLQLLGQLDPNISFSVRPIHYKPGIAKRNTTGATIQDIFNDMDSSGKLFRSIHFDDNKGVIRILPTQFTFKHNSHHPFGWNDEAMIAAKGVQTVVSAGVYSRYGPVSVQFQPQWVRSQNAQFENNASYGATVSGLQEKFLLGQSSALLHVGGFAAGLSTQNLWWGPGQYSSLLLSNHAPGFTHFTLSTTQPFCLPIGSFEGQLVVGRLDEDSSFTGGLYENFHLKPSRLTDQWRYFNAIVVTFQPSFFKNFHLGATRAFQTYKKDFQALGGQFIQRYLPVLTNIFKEKGDDPTGGATRDQQISLFTRWVFPKAHAEFYFEYGWNDHKANLRDFAVDPVHAAAYIVGGRKLLPLNKHSSLEFSAEMTHMSQPVDYVLRGAGNWYVHGGVSQGMTNNRQILGAGSGFGNNVQTAKLTWLKGFTRIGISVQQVQHDPKGLVGGTPLGLRDIFWNEWAYGINGRYRLGRFMLSGDVQFTRSKNYAWDKNQLRDNFYSYLQLSYCW
ncbi:MAG: capsule assembly Wzi family protein [Bacteroidota bacterium]